MSFVAQTPTSPSSMPGPWKRMATYQALLWSNDLIAAARSATTFAYLRISAARAIG